MRTAQGTKPRCVGAHEAPVCTVEPCINDVDLLLGTAWILAALD